MNKSFVYQEETRIKLTDRARRCYTQPQLVEYGTVREITQGEAGRDWDAGGSHQPG